MLQEHDWQTVDLTEFHASGEGFSSWFYKVRKWLGDDRPAIIPDIKITRSRGGRLVLQERAVADYIGKCLNVGESFIEELLAIDIEGLQPAAAFLFASDFSSSDRILLSKHPKQFCISCFKDALLKRQIPVFNAFWNSPWATHCVIHTSPLFPIELLDESKELKLMSFSDATQFAGWCNRVEYAQRQIIHFNIRTPDMRVIPPSFTILAINKLFNSPSLAQEAANSLGLNHPPEVARQNLFTVFYLLSIKHHRKSLGYELSDTDYGIWCFPTATYFSSDILSSLSRERVSRCVEYLACFIGNPKKIHPYLIYREMSEGREGFSKLKSADFSEIQSDPMIFLSWYVWQAFRSGFQENVSKMFPEYASKWKKKFDRIEAFCSG